MQDGTELILSLVQAALRAILFRGVHVQAALSSDIRDSLEPVPLAEREGASLLTKAISFVAVIAVVVLMTISIFLRRRALRGSSPEARARRRLAAVAIATLDSRSLYTELNNILTEYVDARSGIPAIRRTSLELQQLFDRRDDVDARFRATLAGFLAACDQAKFSPSPPLDCNRENAIADCRSIIAGIDAMRDQG